MIYYPLNVGRNMAGNPAPGGCGVQTADEHHVAMPANWQPGQKVVVPTPNTTEAAEERVAAGYECVDWYLCLRELKD